MSMDKIAISGTPYEQGIQQGEQLSPAILENVKNIKEALSENNISRQKYRAATQRNAIFLEKHYPDIFEEMRGIATGARLSFSDILTINVPTYFMLPQFPIECSMLVARGNATCDGNTYLIKNRDMKIIVHQFIVERHYKNGFKISEVNGAGIITYPANGINSCGLAIATTGFWSSKTYNNFDDVDSRHIFVNIHILLEQCKTADDVVESLKCYPRMNGLNIIAADKHSAILIETTRDGQCVERLDKSGVLFRTNHYLLGTNQKLNPSFEEYSSTFARYQRIDNILKQRKAPLRFQDLMKIMSDHTDGAINSVCRHASSVAPITTVSCCIAIVEDQEMFNTPGNPCIHLIHSKLQ